MNRYTVIFVALLGMISPYQVLQASEALVFATAPTQSPQMTRQLYQPLVDYLAKQTGREIILKPAKNFLEYTYGMRKGEYDIVFDGPHFVGWRVAKYNHKVIAKLPGSIRFVVVSRNDARIGDYKDLAGKKVCAFSSPNLLSLAFLDLYPRPGSQPILVRVNSFKEAMECVQNDEGVAAVIRDTYWAAQPYKQKQGLQLIYTTEKGFPHRAFSVGNRVDDKTRDSIVKALIGQGGIESGDAILQRFRSKKFTPAQSSEYVGLDALLKPVWGYSVQ